MEKLEKEMIECVIIHHSKKFFDTPFFIKLRHKFLRFWDDTGYHFLIGNGVLTKDGKIYKGRPLNCVGAHSYGYNRKSIGICLIGDFDYFKPTFRQYRSLIKLILFLKEEGYVIKRIIGHNETEGCTKTCPGKFFPTERFRKLLKKF